MTLLNSAGQVDSLDSGGQPGQAESLDSAGQVDFPAVFAALEERGYRGWIGLEPVDERNGRAELAEAITQLAALS